MLRMLSSWFRRQGVSPGSLPDEARDGAVELVLSLLLPQISLLDLKPGFVPPEGRIANKWSRAYIVGLCDCIFQSATTNLGVDFREADLIEGVFASVYGRYAAKRLAQLSIDEFQDPGKGESVLSGYNRAVTDLNRWKNAKAAGYPDEPPVGFWSFNHGMSFEEIVDWSRTP